MIICLIACITVIFCVVYITQWVRHMAKNDLPMFTRCEFVRYIKDETEQEPNPMGFQAPAPEEEKKPTDEDAKDAIYSDPIRLCAALMRGEVDVDELSRR